MYILNRVVPLWKTGGCEAKSDNRSRLRSKDVALSLSMTLFDNNSIAACIAKQNERDRGDVPPKQAPQVNEGGRSEEQQTPSNAHASVPSKSDNTASLAQAKSDNTPATAPALTQAKSDHNHASVPALTSSRADNTFAAGITTIPSALPAVAPTPTMAQNQPVAPALAATLSSLPVRFDAPGHHIQPPGFYYNPALRPYHAPVATQPPLYYGQQPPPAPSYPSGMPQQPQNPYYPPPNPYTNGQQYPPNPYWRFS